MPEIAQLFGVTVDDILRKTETDIVLVSKPEKKEKTDTKKAPPSLEKRKVQIIITPRTGKVSKVSVPLSLVKTGLRIGGMFGLEADIASKIDAAVESETFGEILTVDGENGETIEIRIE